MWEDEKIHTFKTQIYVCAEQTFNFERIWRSETFKLFYDPDDLCLLLFIKFPLFFFSYTMQDFETKASVIMTANEKLKTQRI